METATPTIKTKTVRQHINSAYKPLFINGDFKPRYIVMMGGRSGGRSYSASQRALAKIRADEYYRCAIMRFSLEDVRNSIFREIQDRINDIGLENAIHIRENPLGFLYRKNRIDGIGFRKSSSQHKSKMKSLAGYNEVIIEEADEVEEADFIQLDDSLRTTKSDITIILMLNAPHKNHWIIKRWFNLVPSGVEGFYKPELKESEKHNAIFISTDYRHNIDNIDQTTVDNFERYLVTKPDHYWNMIRGYVSEGARGRIFKNWKTITDAEFDALPYPTMYGKDFGFSNDPTALLEIKKHNNKVWAREKIYQTGLTNPGIVRELKRLEIPENANIYADSAEPKSIQELIDLGYYNVKPAIKGADSVRAGYDMLLELEICYTEGSTNIATEVQEHKWKLDKNKEPTNEPEDKFNHAIDALRYAVFTEAKTPYTGFI
jgi:phage terminase large subunit